MPSVSSPDQAILRSFPQSVKKYLSIAPRNAVFTCQVNGTPPRDSQSNGLYRFNYDNITGSDSLALVGMSVDVGTTPGARDVGTVRMRKALDGTHLFIEETAYGKLPLVDNYYASVIDEFLPAPKLPRLVGIRNNTSYISSFTEYHDYDVAYSSQNANIQPQANITESATSRRAPRPAGWVDAGQTYRTMVLSSYFSQAFKTSASISSRTWNIKDGSYLVGTSTTVTPTVTFPVGFRIISLTVTDSAGTTHVHYFPIWVHDDTYLPLTSTDDDAPGFRVTSDERDEGRKMGYEIFGKDGTADEDVIPKGCTCCYWEEPDFNGETTPEQYIDSFLGWATDESTTIKLYDRSVMTLNVGGIQTWLSSFAGFGQKLNYAATVNRWFKMGSITIDRVIHYVLREYSTALSFCNFYSTGITTTVKAEDIKKSDIWNQCVELAKGYDGSCIADSLNDIWLRQHYSYLETADRSAVQIIMNLNSQDWTDEAGLQIDESYIDEVSIVTGTGSYVAGNKNHLIYSKAPGLVPAHGGSDEEANFQRLTSTSSQDKLNRLTGHHYARANNKRKAVTLKLLANMDVFERAWGEPVTLTWAESNLRGIVINTDEFLITKISVNHNVEFGQPAKIVTLSLEQATIGNKGDTYTPPDSPNPPPATTSTNYPNMDIITYTPFEWFNLPPSVPSLAVFHDAISASERYYVLANTHDDKVEWTEAFSSGSGTGIQFTHDPFSPLYLNTGTTVNGWWMCDTLFNRLTDVFGSVGTTAQTSHPVTFSDNIFGTAQLIFPSRITQNFVMALGYYDIHGDGSEYRTYLCRTTDGTNWSYDASVIPDRLASLGILLYYIHMANHTPGLVYLSGGGTFWQSTDYGATWTDITATHGLLTGVSFDHILHLPYAANPSDLRFYFSVDKIVGIISGHLVDAVTSGNKWYYYDMGTMTLATLPWPSITKYQFGYLTTCDKDPTRLAAIMYGVLDIDGTWHGVTLPHTPYQIAYLMTSRNAGKTWVDRGEVADAHRIKITSKSPDFLYIYGAQPKYLPSGDPSITDPGEAYISVSKDFGKTIIDGTRNLLDFSTPATLRIHDICGAY